VRPRTCFVALLLVVASLIGITSSADEEPLTMRCPSSGTPSDYACLEWRAPVGAWLEEPDGSLKIHFSGGVVVRVEH